METNNASIADDMAAAGNSSGNRTYDPTCGVFDEVSFFICAQLDKDRK